MTIDFKDEYATLRQEMLARFERIHDTAKYGTGAFIALLSYYYANPSFDDLIALTIFQLMIAIIGMSFLRLYQSVYNIGTYIAVKIECDSEAKWHRMSRQKDSYEEKSGNIVWTQRLPFPLGKRWGADSAQFAILLITLMLLGLGAVFFKAPAFLDFQNLYTLQWIFIAFIIIVLFCNVIVVYQLWWGMRNFMHNNVETWKKYGRSFGSDIADSYSAGPLPEPLNNKSKKNEDSD